MYFVHLEIDADLDWGWDGTLVYTVYESRKANSRPEAEEYLKERLNHIINNIHCFREETRMDALRMLLEHHSLIVHPIDVQGGEYVSNGNETNRGNWSIKTSIVDISALKDVNE